MIAQQITPEQLNRVRNEWGAIAGEEISVSLICGHIYAFGSELACLRLAYKFKNSQGVRAEFSKNLNSWYFVLD